MNKEPGIPLFILHFFSQKPYEQTDKHTCIFISNNIKSVIPIRFQNILSLTYPHKGLLMHVLNRIIHKSKWEQRKCPSAGEFIDIPIKYHYHGILFSGKKKNENELVYAK